MVKLFRFFFSIHIHICWYKNTKFNLLRGHRILRNCIEKERPLLFSYFTFLLYCNFFYFVTNVHKFIRNTIFSKENFYFRTCKKCNVIRTKICKRTNDGSWEILLLARLKNMCEQNDLFIFPKRPIDQIIRTFPFPLIHRVLLRVRLTSIRDRVSIDSASRRAARQLKIMTFVWLLFEDQTQPHLRKLCCRRSWRRSTLLAERKGKERKIEKEEEQGRNGKLVGRQCI